MASGKAARKPTKVGDKTILARNRRALHDYEVLETFEAGMVLAGTEVKAAREGKVQLKEAYVDVRNGEAWLVGAHISPYTHGNLQNHPADRDRKLLLSRRELDRIYGRTQLKGQTAIPLSVYLRGNWLKLEVALALGKKLFDKREAVKKRILDREAEAAIKGGDSHR